MRNIITPAPYEKAYTIVLNRILARFTMFDDVFGEYKRTVLKIVRGRCLASENLQDLARYWERNCQQFSRFLDCIGQTAAPPEFQQFHQVLTGELRHFYNQVCTAQQAINWGQNSCCQTTLQDAFNEMTCIRDRIDHALQNVNGVAM